MAKKDAACQLPGIHKLYIEIIPKFILFRWIEHIFVGQVVSCVYIADSFQLTWIHRLESVDGRILLSFTRGGIIMLMAILYRQNGDVAAAALAADQQPLGTRYWSEVHASGIHATPEMETAYVDITDEWLVRRLISMNFADAAEAAEAVDTYLGLTNDPDTPIILAK